MANCIDIILGKFLPSCLFPIVHDYFRGFFGQYLYSFDVNYFDKDFGKLCVYDGKVCLINKRNEIRIYTENGKLLFECAYKYCKYDKIVFIDNKEIITWNYHSNNIKIFPSNSKIPNRIINHKPIPTKYRKHLYNIHIEHDYIIIPSDTQIICYSRDGNTHYETTTNKDKFNKCDMRVSCLGGLESYSEHWTTIVKYTKDSNKINLSKYARLGFTKPYFVLYNEIILCGHILDKNYLLIDDTPEILIDISNYVQHIDYMIMSDTGLLFILDHKMSKIHVFY